MYLYYAPQLEAKQRTIDEKTATIAQLGQAMVSLNAQIASLQAQVITLESEKASLADKLANATSQIQTLNDRIDSLDGQIQGLVGNLTTLTTLLAQAQNPRDFNSEVELLFFLRGDDTDALSYAPVSFDCDDFAITLQWNALRKGFRMYTVAVWEGSLLYITQDGTKYYKVTYAHGYYSSTEKLWIVGNHFMNLCLVKGRGWYLVEPQTDAIYPLNVIEL